MKEVKERNIEKHEITPEEINFLIALQKEMNTQDTVCQAEPRFWMIEHPEKSVVPEDYEDGIELYDTYDAETIGDFNDSVEYFLEKLENLEVRYVNDESYRIAKIGKNNKCEAEEIIDCHIKDLVKFLEEQEMVEKGRYSVCFYANANVLCKDTMFITHKSCVEHLSKYGYNYHSGAHPFAMTAYRSPEVEKLWKILETVDWEKLKK